MSVASEPIQPFPSLLRALRVQLLLGAFCGGDPAALGAALNPPAWNSCQTAIAAEPRWTRDGGRGCAVPLRHPGPLLSGTSWSV